MSDTFRITRRTALLGAGAGGGALLLAACSGSSSGSDDPSVATTTASSAETTAESSVAVTTSAAPPTTQAPTTAAPTGTKIIALSDVPVGGGVLANDKAGQRIVVAQPTAGTAVAFSAICTHMGCTVEAPAGATITCKCHGSSFNTFTGAVTNSPATKALPQVAVSVVDGAVVQA